MCYFHFCLISICSFYLAKSAWMWQQLLWFLIFIIFSFINLLNQQRLKLLLCSRSCIVETSWIWAKAQCVGLQMTGISSVAIIIIIIIMHTVSSKLPFFFQVKNRHESFYDKCQASSLSLHFKGIVSSGNECCFFKNTHVFTLHLSWVEKRTPNPNQMKSVATNLLT